MRLSIIIPLLNEAEMLIERLRALQWLRHSGHELIAVDGGSQDKSPLLAEPWVDKVVISPAGRALQMNKGAEVANGDVLLFLHIDTILPEESIELIGDSLKNKKMAWGRFDVCLSGRHWMFRVIEKMMNWRSRITGIATGDQAIFVTRTLFEQQSGFLDIPLMEDIELSQRLKKIIAPCCLQQTVMTSSRRWEKAGVYKTIWLMWRLRFAYWLGASPKNLVRLYK
jgi:rSAM/selenodomain-associated transferase 2